MWMAVGLAASLGFVTEAKAVPPHEDLLTPGELRGISWAPGDPWLYGYWEYLPANYDEAGPYDTYPLLVFLAGVGEYDDVPVCPAGADVCSADACGNDGLCRNLTWGPQQHIRAGNWDDTQRPFIMISPQHPIPPFTTQEWNIDNLDAFMQYVEDNYPIDPRRTYLIGMSQGGRAVLQYTWQHSRRFTAVAPAPGGLISPTDASCYFQDTALWVFHGENDAEGILGAGVFAPCQMVNVAYQYNNPALYGSMQCQSIVGEPRPEGRISMFHNVAHFSWVQTVDPVGSGFPASEWTADEGCGIPATFREYEAALDLDGVYSWFLSLDRPAATAPADFEIDVPNTSLTVYVADDDPIATYEWTQISGPGVTLMNDDQETLLVSDMAENQQYEFEVRVVDADGQWDVDSTIVSTVEFGGVGSSSSDGGPSSTTTDDGGPLTTTDDGGPVTTTDDGGPLTTTDDGGPLTTTDDGGPLTTTDDGGPLTTTDDGGPLTTDDGGPLTTDDGGTTAGDDGGTTVSPGSTTDGDGGSTLDGGTTFGDTDTGGGGQSTGIPPMTTATTASTVGGSSGGDTEGETEDSGGGASDDTGCSCTSDPADRNAPWLLLLIGVGLARRRRLRA